MTEENESVADKFLENHSDFEPYSLSSAFEKYNINIPDFQKGQHTLSLLPSIHETDGFFIAKFKKK
jgi:16S rRNA (cytosine967-C5)-methyltransferase